ncbi:MAG: hypothetical protein ABIG63_14495 [Chloroflexota bacterium]
MTVRIGTLYFDSWHSFHLSNGWSDTFVFPISTNAGLPPSDYAKIARRLTYPLTGVRSSASVWLPVNGPDGNWYIEAVRRTLRGKKSPKNTPVAITRGMARQPTLDDFSFMPWADRYPSPPPPVIDNPVPANLSSHELACLRALIRVPVATTKEVAAMMGRSLPTARQALYETVRRGLAAQILEKPSEELTDDEKKKLPSYYPAWEIRRPGVTAVYRSWGIPARISFPGKRVREYRVGKRHRQTSRLWKAWLQQAWPYADIWAGWTEISLDDYQPDAVAWGRLWGAETLFCLEVESGNATKKKLREKITHKFN